MNKNPVVHVLVFNQNVPIQKLKTFLDKQENQHPFLCLTTHKLFETEISELIAGKGDQTVTFASFADLLTDDQMADCDESAYQIEISEDNPLNLRQSRYYSLIAQLKNELVYAKLAGQYEIGNSYLLTDGLGIDAKVWLGRGFTDLREQFNHCLLQTAERKPGLPLRLLSAARRLINHLIIFPRVVLIRHGEKNILFLGSVTRVKNRLSATDFIKPKITVSHSIGYLARLILFIMAAPVLLVRKIPKEEVLRLFLQKELLILAKNYHIDYFATTIHEYYSGIPIDSKVKSGKEFVILQDGFLPENYSSRYLNYITRADCFFVWNKFGLRLFQKHGLTAKVSTIFKPFKIPPPVPISQPIKKVLIATSGAGDWTALKNRSDEDLMVEAFVEVAAKFPKIEFIYRCHPLWIHPDHQGVNSINRVAEYFEKTGLKNILVSRESIIQSRKAKGLFIPPKSFDDDLQGVSIVFGEHSISMVDAAFKGIIFTSVNLTNRRDFFSNYTGLGFPHLKSVDEIIDFLLNLQKSNEIVGIFNRAVIEYNRFNNFK